MKYLSDQESTEIRTQLINAGILTPANGNELANKNGRISFSTKEKVLGIRSKLIEQGFISEERVELMPKEERGKSAEEGAYSIRPIKTDEDYERKRAVYLYMLQDILISRRELNLDLGPLKSNEDWMF